ncbi:hypothetical protein COLO4_02179 [Corchorus olitorius]|uniref:Uncharacterized protein n=1 Tax=Corchorus olitorius TaxID=93759 RepID=A0A1R3L1I4_9ROSI|nr:hypothetical protein COLO4_02179 [Corchorus olitorius]
MAWSNRASMIAIVFRLVDPTRRLAPHLCPC